MSHIESFTSTAMADQMPVTGMSPADFARVVGLDERTYHDGNVLPTFGITNPGLEDDELAQLLVAHSEYPRVPAVPSEPEFVGSTAAEVLRVRPELGDLVDRASSVFTASDGYFLVVDRDHGILTLIT